MRGGIIQDHEQRVCRVFRFDLFKIFNRMFRQHIGQIVRWLVFVSDAKVFGVGNRWRRAGHFALFALSRSLPVRDFVIEISAVSFETKPFVPSWRDICSVVIVQILSKERGTISLFLKPDTIRLRLELLLPVVSSAIVVIRQGKMVVRIKTCSVYKLYLNDKRGIVLTCQHAAA